MEGLSHLVSTDLEALMDSVDEASWRQQVFSNQMLNFWS